MWVVAPDRVVVAHIAAIERYVAAAMLLDLDGEGADRTGWMRDSTDGFGRMIVVQAELFEVHHPAGAVTHDLPGREDLRVVNFAIGETGKIDRP